MFQNFKQYSGAFQNFQLFVRWRKFSRDKFLQNVSRDLFAVRVDAELVGFGKFFAGPVNNRVYLFYIMDNRDVIVVGGGATLLKICVIVFSVYQIY